MEKQWTNDKIRILILRINFKNNKSHDILKVNQLIKS